MLCIKSVRNSTHKAVELVIVDDNSSDGTEKTTPAVIRRKTGYFGKIRVIHNRDGQKMMVKSRNQGARAAKGDLVLFIDDDNEIDRDMIKLLANFASKHPEYGILGPSMYYGNDRLYMHHQRINLFTGWTQGVMEKDGREYYDTDGVPNVFMIRKEVFKKAGYFDETLVQTFTEPDFSYNALKYGFKSCMLRSAKTIHKVYFREIVMPRGLGGKFEQKAYCLMRNRALIISRYGKWYHKAVYSVFFSWFWPLLYSFLMLRYLRFDLIRIYWTGFADGMIYLLTGRLNNRIKELLKMTD